ncbi:MarR family transcriptional regulator [Oleiphilus messinensis]|uniref:MarR family transcriptional regulator n=1 Tax=Oleiphilus messinensis TaxID=141451 RepID=A0A1Y0IHM6_9GAMM|nr:MarR family winged helix-turn-helix transcriptional regulator [Oleiphilus messinensis]ARU58923.1 MarR family transcriptional regulator [Oleiphilus messinensis]
MTDEKTFKIEPCLNLELRKANRVMSQIYDHYLASCGIKTSQYSILRAIYLLRETTNSQLQDILILDQTTLSRGVKPLIRDGFIEVRPGVDRRQKLLALTESGRALFKAAEVCWNDAQKFVSKRLGHDIKNELLKLTHAVVELKR